MECYRKKTISWKAKDGRFGVADVRCGSCVPCLLKSSREWSFRCSLEYKLCQKACTITLTIDEDHIHLFPDGVNRYELQKFFKRLRRAHDGDVIRYFGSAEYGSLRGRPHYHVILFGYDPDDKRYFKCSKKGTPIYTSVELSRLWTYGFVSVEPFSDNTAIYCTKYLNKIKRQIPDVNPPFSFMSLRPSIGFNALSMEDFERGYIWMNGYKHMIPRSYYQTLRRKGIEFPELAQARIEFVLNVDDLELDKSIEDSFRKSGIMLDKYHYL